jgi:hypothetical protein
MNASQVDRLAATFLRQLRKEVTAAQYREIRRRNATESNPAICHSHDFCDANMSMLAAFASEGLDMPETDEAERAWGRVWDRAKVLLQTSKNP